MKRLLGTKETITVGLEDHQDSLPDKQWAWAEDPSTGAQVQKDTAQGLLLSEEYSLHAYKKEWEKVLTAKDEWGTRGDKLWGQVHKDPQR